MYYVENDTFSNYARKEHNISSHKLHYVENRFYTPVVIEKSTENMTSLSIFDKLATKRTMFITGEVNDEMSSIICAQMLYMDTISNLPITYYVDSPGGSVKSGFTIYDCRMLISSDVKTVCIGNGASMGSILTGMGTKGMRAILPHAKIMLHQASGGFSGNVQDAKIIFNELDSYNETLFKLLGEFTNKSAETIKKDAERDLWLQGEKAVEYGIVDFVLTKENRNK